MQPVQRDLLGAVSVCELKRRSARWCTHTTGHIDIHIHWSHLAPHIHVRCRNKSAWRRLGARLPRRARSRIEFETEREAAAHQKNLSGLRALKSANFSRIVTPHDDARRTTRTDTRARSHTSHTLIRHSGVSVASHTCRRHELEHGTVTHRLRHLMHQSPSVCTTKHKSNPAGQPRC